MRESINTNDLEKKLEATLKAHFISAQERVSQGFTSDDIRNKGYWEGRMALCQSLLLELLNIQLKK